MFSEKLDYSLFVTLEKSPSKLSMGLLTVYLYFLVNRKSINIKSQTWKMLEYYCHKSGL
jgi:hypothetical protein